MGFKAGKKDIKNTITKLRDRGCLCKVNVVFAQNAELVQLFLAAHEEDYEAEWVVGDRLNGSLAELARDVKKELEKKNRKDYSVYEILQGMCQLIIE